MTCLDSQWLYKASLVLSHDMLYVFVSVCLQNWVEHLPECAFCLSLKWAKVKDPKQPLLDHKTNQKLLRQNHKTPYLLNTLTKFVPCTQQPPLTLSGAANQCLVPAHLLLLVIKVSCIWELCSGRSHLYQSITNLAPFQSTSSNVHSASIWSQKSTKLRVRVSFKDCKQCNHRRNHPIWWLEVSTESPLPSSETWSKHHQKQTSSACGPQRRNPSGLLR